MNIVDIYNNIKNPIDDKEYIKRLIELYSKPRVGGTYSLVTHSVKTKNNQYSQKDRDIFYSVMFNYWKSCMLSITPIELETIKKEDKKNTYGKDYYKLIEILKTIPNFEKEQDVENFKRRISLDPELSEAYENYRWDKPSDYFEKVRSYYVTGRKISSNRIKTNHRLYINIESSIIFKMAFFFQKKCINRKIPYDFKFDDIAERDDAFVIYTSNELLPQYIDILKEIKSEHPEFNDSIDKPPILTGAIDGWIGYGTEPLPNEYGNNKSFNEVRSKIIDESFKNVNIKWILNHQNIKIKVNGVDLPLIDYFSYGTTIIFCNKLKTNLQNELKVKDIRKKKYGENYDPNEIYNKFGYNFADLEQDSFKSIIYNQIKNQIKSKFDNIKNEINLYLINGKKLFFGTVDFMDGLNQISKKIMELDSNYINLIQNEIKNNCLKNGVDPNNFCFDTYMTNIIKSVSPSNNQPSSHNLNSIKK